MRDNRVAPGPELQVTKQGADISTAASVISAVSGKRIVITDILISTGTAGDFSVLDDSTIVFKAFLGADGTFSSNLSTPLTTSSGGAVKVQSSTSNTNYCVTLTYYVET
jgi:hypothetical protein